MERCVASVAAYLHGLELELVDTQVRKDAGRLLELLAEDFREFGSSGRVFTRDRTVAMLAEEGAAEIALTDFIAERLGEECVQVTYRARRCKDGLLMQESLRSSIWVEREGRWQMVFHQGTKVGGS